MQPTISITQFIIAVASASFATFLGSTAVEVFKNYRHNKKARAEYKSQLAIEFEQLVKMLIKLKSEYRARHYFPINILELLAGGLLRTEERLKLVSLISDAELQREIYELVADCRILVIEINGMEAWVVEKDTVADERARRTEQAKEQRPEKNVELSDIQRRLEDAIKKLKT